MGIPAQLSAGRRRGIALPAAMMGLALVAILITGVFRLGSSGSRSATSRESAARALMLAEEGAAHAMTVLRENLAGRTSTQLLVGPDNSPSGADNGRLVWSSLSSALQVPAGGKTTTGGSYTIQIVDDPAETDNNSFVDRNDRLLVTCTGTATDGSSATVSVVVRSAPTPGIAVDGNVTLSAGNLKIKGDCGSVHANGQVDLSGTVTVAGQLSSSTRIGSGALKDTLGNAMTPRTGAPALEVPDLDPMDYCGAGSYDYRLFYSGGKHWIHQRSTNTTYDLGAGARFGWEKDGAAPETGFKLSGTDAVDGKVCVEGYVIVSGNPGTATTPRMMSIYASGSVEISGNPFMQPAPGDSVIIMSGGDVKLNGTLDATQRNFDGMVYADSQCQVSGTPRLGGQLICKNNPQTPYTKDFFSSNVISGDASIEYSCNAKVAGRRRQLLWSQPVM